LSTGYFFCAGASLDAAAAWDRLIELALNGSEAGRLPTRAHPGGVRQGGGGPLEAGLAPRAAQAGDYVQARAGQQGRAASIGRTDERASNTHAILAKHAS